MKAAAAVLIFLVATAFCLFGPNLHSGFLLDDYALLANCRHAVFSNIAHTDGGQTWVRPVPWGIFGLIWATWGAVPEPFHVFSILCLALTSFLIWAIWQTIFPGKQWGGALGAALLFLLWPNHGEAVCWVGCYCDVTAGLFALAAIWAWLRFDLQPSGGRALLGMLLCFIAIASKEAALPLVFAAPLFCWLSHFSRTGIAADREWLRRKATLVLAVAPTLAIGAFWLIRTAMIRAAVGGYTGHSPFYSGLTHLIGPRGLAEVNNLFIPFARLGLLVGRSLAGTVVSACIWLGLLAIAFTWPTDGERSRERRLSLGAAAWLAVWALVRFIDSGGWIELIRTLLGPVYAIVEGTILILVLRAAIEWDRRAGGEIEQMRSAVLWIALLSGAYVYESAVTSLEVAWVGILLLAAVFGLRPGVPNRDTSSVRWAFIAVGIALAVMSIFIVINLPVSLDGQWERFSYFGSMFSVMAISAALEGVSVKYRGALWLSALVGCGVLSISYNARWFRVGRIASETAAIVRSARPGSRVYVLTAPGTVEAAGLLEIGIPEMPEALTGDRSIAARVAFMSAGSARDRVVVSRTSADTFRIDLQKDSGQRFNSLLLFKASELFSPVEDGVRLNGYRPGDMVLYIDASGPHRLE